MKKIILIILLGSISHCVFPQGGTGGGATVYFGQGASSSGTGNLSIGYNTGYAGSYNASIGYRAGDKVTGSNNSFLGAFAGFNVVPGAYNAFFGYNSGYNTVTGNYNTYLGTHSGYNSTGSRNIFIGFQAGYNELGSDKLYIDNSNTSSPLVYGDFASNILTINGSLGVGLINPTEKVEIDGSVFINKENSGIIIDGNGKKRVGFMKYFQHEAGIWRTNTQDFEIGRVTSLTDVTEGLGSTPVVDMYFSENGNIGIGTTAPDSHLAVNGKIKALEVEVTADGWADFVFEEDYDLPDLVDVEAHIKEKKHLPGIPSAAEVGENGINLGAMDALLLQKIEELTLYIIQQDKQLKELKEEMKSLQTSAIK